MIHTVFIPIVAVAIYHEFQLCLSPATINFNFEGNCYLRMALIILDDKGARTTHKMVAEQNGRKSTIIPMAGEKHT